MIGRGDGGRRLQEAKRGFLLQNRPLGYRLRSHLSSGKRYSKCWFLGTIWKAGHDWEQAIDSQHAGGNTIGDSKWAHPLPLRLPGSILQPRGLPLWFSRQEVTQANEHWTVPRTNLISECPQPSQVPAIAPQHLCPHKLTPFSHFPSPGSCLHTSGWWAPLVPHPPSQITESQDVCFHLYVSCGLTPPSFCTLLPHPQDRALSNRYFFQRVRTHLHAWSSFYLWAGEGQRGRE